MERLIIGTALVVLFTAFLWWLPDTRPGRGYADEDSAWDPPFLVENILTMDECREIIAKAEPRFARSTVVADETVQNSRTSETAWISKDDPLARKVLQKAMEITGKPFANCEDLQVVRYKPGTYYRAHHDSCCEDNKHCKDFESKGGQRVGTLLLYLNSDFTEGQTHFPDFKNLKITARPGSAIFFRPLGTWDKRCHPFALHAGLPIATGTKYVCNIWVRENEFVR
jgi:prolyl 4-hydroxylase